LLANAFQAAWERALKDELVSAANVVDYLESRALAEAAFVRWRADDLMWDAPLSAALN
jgi:hypothetical protein